MNVVKIPSAAVIIEMGKECVMDILVANLMFWPKNGIAPANEMIRNEDDLLLTIICFANLIQ